jgi:hypothetical protein
LSLFGNFFTVADGGFSISPVLAFLDYTAVEWCAKVLPA